MKKAIYTTLVGNYDSIQQPKVIAEGYDYILFSDTIPEQQMGVWQVRHFDYHNPDKTKMSRYPKTHPNELLPNYDYSLYIDSNVVIDDPRFFERINELIDAGVSLAGMDHDKRWCLYEEAIEIMYQRYDSAYRVCKTILHHKHNGFPKKFGLNENNIILRNHHNNGVHQLNLDWWSMIMKYSRRDQLSYRYAVWKNNLRVELILPEKQNSRNHPYVHCEKHLRQSTIDDIIWFDIRDQYRTTITRFYEVMLSAADHSIAEKIAFGKIMLIEAYYLLKFRKYKICHAIKQKK